jgi:hypothetical protein
MKKLPQSVNIFTGDSAMLGTTKKNVDFLVVMV